MMPVMVFVLIEYIPAAILVAYIFYDKRKSCYEGKVFSSSQNP